MKYHNVLSGIFIKRVNRFIAHVYINEMEQIVHVKNTGRLKELLLPGAAVVLEESDRPERKTKFSLIGVYKDNRLINIDSQVPNQVVFEALTKGDIQEIGRPQTHRREVTYGNSRFDLYFESERRKGFIEVKGVTLEHDGIAMFPDAPTIRGKRHIYEMIEAVNEGFIGYLFFLVQMKNVRYFTPHTQMDPDFANALTLAAKQGVNIVAYDSIISRDEIILGEPVEVKLA